MNDQYALPRNASETDRLNTQDHIWVSSVGFRAHPEAVKSIPKAARIADVGTGTGVWLIRLDSEAYQLEGLDMSDSQYPKEHPSNVSFHILNLLEPLPEHYKARYDLIHVRLLMAGMRAGTWAIAAANLLEMLKPGGFVQWEEGDFEHLNILQHEPLAATDGLKKLWSIGLTAAESMMTDAAVRMPTILKDAGFASAYSSVTSSDREPGTRQAFTQVMIRVLSAIATWHASHGNEGKVDLSEVEKLSNQAMDESQGAKAYMQVPIYCTLGQKAV